MCDVIATIFIVIWVIFNIGLSIHKEKNSDYDEKYKMAMKEAVIANSRAIELLIKLEVSKNDISKTIKDEEINKIRSELFCARNKLYNWYIDDSWR